MQMELAGLLRSCEIVHPGRIAAVSVGHDVLRISIAGYPWWAEPARRQGESVLVLCFEGIVEGFLAASDMTDFEHDEVLETLEVNALARNEWGEPSEYEIFCNGPLTDPFALYANIEDYLWQANAPRTARDYLNVPDGLLSRFKQVAATSSYLVGRGPVAIRDIMIEVLERQKVPYNIVSHKLPADLLAVRLGASQFICNAATAIFD